MTDERQRPKRIDLPGHLMVAAIVAVLWACSWGLAQGQGVMALQPGSQDPGAKILKPPIGKRLITLEQMKLPGVAGTTLRTRKHWPWSDLEKWVSTVHRAGDKWTWLPCGGDEPNPLSASSLAAREKLYRDGGERYAIDPSLYGVHACVPPFGHSEEGFFGKKMPVAAKEAQKRMIAVAAVAFPTQRIIWTGGPEDPAANLEIVRYGVKVAPGRFVYKMNAMSPKDNFGWSGTTLLIDSAKLGADIAFEQLQPSNHPKFGGTWTQFVAKVKEVERRSGKRFVLECIYPGDLAKAGGLK